ncbi:MAG: heme-binding protein [Candidatus Thiodiazotropha sp. (ex Ctena orbiculata)]|nr:heme-binding protein [Candidatus Thiodiazotropha taylori]MBT2998316.1 heme-binding protein [Candidatus Thiodiazotropha taylori]MBT3002573.1 heme-binding protein [Candidatus Thiodiazotropha taylori]MBV2106036.1 heme-binding protein [Candidatus Thiodiazotropha taylori]MBV2110031.1 heme-binding protein [Candidatus Thiodiazotropha taylori]
MLLRTGRLLTLALMVLSTPLVADPVEENSLYRFRSLSLELASKAAWGAIETCRKRGYSIAVAVVDRGGNVQAQLRDRFAGPHTPETAMRKAWTANSFRQSTAQLAGMLEERRIPAQVANNPGALLVGGGLPIEAGGEIVGGIGVSGAPPGKSERDSIDGACAIAALERIRESLEFAD